jgi:hypothetical protein
MALFTDYAGALAYIKGGRNKTSRSVSSRWSVKLVDPSDANTNIAIYKTKDPEELEYLTYHKDGTVQLDCHDNHMDRHSNDLFTQYSGIEGLAITWRALYFPALGVIPASTEDCRSCRATGKVNETCFGPVGMCDYAASIPKYLRDTGAPGAHCPHGYTKRHKAETCLHGQKGSHLLGEITCPSCSGTGGVVTPECPAWFHWPNLSGYVKSPPIRIKDGAILD